MPEKHKKPTTNSQYIENAIWHIRQIDGFDNNSDLISLTIKLFAILHQINGIVREDNHSGNRVVYEMTPEFEAQLQEFMFYQQQGNLTTNSTSSDNRGNGGNGGNASVVKLRPKVEWLYKTNWRVLFTPFNGY